MKKMMTCSRNALLIMLAAAVLLSVSACGEENTSAETNVPSETTDVQKTVPEETKLTAALPETDWGGKEFRVLGYECSRDQFDNFEIDTAELTGEVVNDAVFNRNRAIEAQYNVVIRQILDESNVNDWNKATAPHLRKTVQAGEDLYDLAFVTLFQGGALIREGMFIDLNTVNYIDFSMPWWTEDANTSFAVSGKQYLATSDFSLRGKNRVYILGYNKDMHKNFGLEDPIALVHEGGWTLDVFNVWTETAASDLNGNGMVDFEDRFGLSCDSANGLPALMYGCGVQGAKNVDGVMQLTLYSEYAADALSKVMQTYGRTDTTVICEDWNGKVDFDIWSVSSRLFYEGRTLLTLAFPHSLEAWSEKCVNDYGILPFPKYDEAQEKYYSWAESHNMLFGVPVTTAEADFAGFMLEALSYASSDTTLPAYYETTCKNKYTYDPDSAEMLDIIFDGIIYDPAGLYNISGVGSLLYELGLKRTDNFASSYAAKENGALQDLEKLLGDIEKLP